MTKLYKLYVDELGTPHPKNYDDSPYYIIIGCIIEEQFQAELENYSNHIKFKYWGRTDVILHSAEIAHNNSDFAIFRQNEPLKKAFLDDMFALIQWAPVVVTAALIDKHRAFDAQWMEATTISAAADSVFFNFLAFAFTKLPCRGHIIIEASSAHRDREYLGSFHKLLSPHFSKDFPEFQNVRDCLTSLNFVTKQNYDIESQISDLFAYGVRCNYEQARGIRVFEKGSYEERLVSVLQAKLLRSSPSMGREKKKYFDMVEAVEILPKL